MALKTFNISEAVYKQFSSFCKQNGFSMSKQVEIFMNSIVEKSPSARLEYIKKLDILRQGNFMKVKDFAKQYKI